MPQQKTQCPECSAQYKLPLKAINNPNARACCHHCFHVFFINKNLCPSPSKAAVDTVASDERPSSIQSVAASQSKDLMNEASTNEWLNHYSSLSEDSDSHEAHIEGDAVNPHEHSLAHDSNPHEADTDSVSKARQTESHTFSSDKDAEHSASTNLLNNSATTVSQIDTTSSVHDDEGLGKLLSDFGVPIAEPTTKSKEEVLAKINSRLQSEQTSHSARTKTEQRSVVGRLLWGLGCASLALLLIAQYVIFNIDSLIKDPRYASKLTSFCQMAQCTLPGADIDKFDVADIKHSASRISDAGTHSDIMATLINHNDEDQLFPNIKVSLYGQSGLIGDFIASPDEYLIPTQRLILANHSQQLMFTLPIKSSSITEIEMTPFY